MGKLVGIFATDIASRVQGKIYQKLQDRLSPLGYTLVFFDGELNRVDFRTTDQSAFRLLEIADKMEFVAFFLHVESLQNRELIDAIIANGKKRDIPVILYDCNNYGYSKENGVVTINPNYKQGFEAAVNHVIEHHGCRDIYMLAGTEGNCYSEERIEAYKKTMNAHGLVCTDDRIAYGGFWEVPAIAAVSEWMDRIHDKKLPIPEAICCANDSMAIATVKELTRRGYRVPEDILITGFDGIEDGKYSTPAISTCEPVLAAVPEYIIKIIENDIRSDDFLIPLRFIPKESCDCAQNYIPGDVQEMARIVESVRRKSWQHSMLSNLQLALMNSCNIDELLGGMLGTLKHFKGLGLLYCIREDMETQEDFRTDFDKLRVRLNFDFYQETDFLPFPKADIIPEFEKTILNARNNEFFAFQILHSAEDHFGYSVIKATTYENNEMRIFSQFAESFTNMLESVLRNIKLEQANKKLNEMYNKMSEIYIRDMLTGLYNRAGYYKVMDEYLEKEAIKKGYLHIVMTDMDNLKYINDHFGHKEGDLAIQMVAAAITECFAQPCICARFGGDEFMVALFAESDTEPTATQISDHLNAYLQKEIAKNEKPYHIGVSVGHAVGRISTAEELKRLEISADANMYQNKRERKKTK